MSCKAARSDLLTARFAARGRGLALAPSLLNLLLISP